MMCAEENARLYGRRSSYAVRPRRFSQRRAVFGIKDEDRLLHMYLIGKTGTGKSTLLENMALQDLERGHGFALIDPHGDLVARIAARVLHLGGMT